MAAEPLAGRTALVTGASRGIGREMSRLFMDAGARVALLSRDIDSMVALIKEQPQKRAASAFPVDLSDPDTLMPVLEKVAAWIGGAPDVIVNNAGAFTIAPLEETPIDAIKNALRLNVASPFRVERVPGIRHVIGARGMHEALREELKGTGVRATLISPGPTDTDIWDAVDPDNKPGFTPRAKMLKPGDVARAVLWTVTQPPSVNVDEMRLSHS